MERYSHSNVLKIFPDIDPALLKSWRTLGLIAQAFGLPWLIGTLVRPGHSISIQTGQ